MRPETICHKGGAPHLDSWDTRQPDNRAKAQTTTIAALYALTLSWLISRTFLSTHHYVRPLDNPSCTLEYPKVNNGCPNLAKCSCYLGERAPCHWCSFTSIAFQLSLTNKSKSKNLPWVHRRLEKDVVVRWSKKKSSKMDRMWEGGGKGNRNRKKEWSEKVLVELLLLQSDFSCVQVPGR